MTCCPPAPPPPEVCTWTAIGDGKSCIPYDQIKANASAICAEQKAEPRSIYPADDCKGGATIAKLECCSAPPNEPPPPQDPSKDPAPPLPPK